ncbi:MAG: energy-coupling factor transporter transmembrane protein EcfT [Chloroflexi bacterium]|nr:MAG: energy-coupling factor transporter transmembrane protein EcfT [Chloroflexota bacterium]
MENFDLLRNVTIGQYIPTGSVIHRLDPRAKLLGAFFLILAFTFNSSLIANFVMMLAVLGIAKVSGISFQYILRGLLLGLPILVFIFVMQFLFTGSVEPSGAVYFEWGWLRITRYSGWLIVLSLMRITAFIFLTSLITMTATITELTHGIESLLRPFRRLRVPSHELALIVTIALRFVPTLAEEMERILKAQASRGAEIGTRRTWRPDKAARDFLPLIVPLFIGALQRAEDLIWAMEARCYVGGDNRTNYIQLRSSPRDYWVVGLAILFFLVMTFTPWPDAHVVLEAVGIEGL